MPSTYSVYYCTTCGLVPASYIPSSSFESSVLLASFKNVPSVRLHFIFLFKLFGGGHALVTPPEAAAALCPSSLLISGHHWKLLSQAMPHVYILYDNQLQPGHKQKSSQIVELFCQEST